MEIGQRLKEARQSVGMTLEDAAKKTGIVASTLSEFENEKREPKVSQLAELARCYHRSLAFFVSGDTVTASQVQWREKPEDNIAKERERRFLKMCEQYRHLETWCDDFIVPRLPQVSKKPNNYADAEELARRVGSELELGERPAFALLRALERDCGIKIFHDDFEPTGTAACVNSDETGMAILLNRGNTPERRQFDAAHELYHLLVSHCVASVKPTDDSESITEEKLAGNFASRLLLPAEALQRAVDRRLSGDGELPCNELPEIAQEFGVSVEALAWGIYRAYNFGKERKGEIERAIDEAKTTEAFLSHASEAPPKPPKYPERYRALAIRALLNGEISVGKFAEYMEVSRREAMSHLRSEEDCRGQIQVAAR